MYAQGVIIGILPETSELSVLDRWVLARLDQTLRTVTKDLDKFNTVRAGRMIVDFINDLSTWYVRRSRDRIKGNDAAAQRTLHVLGYVLAETAKMLAPFMPFLSEFIFKDLTGKESGALRKLV